MPLKNSETIWYLGVLEAADGRRFGVEYMVVVFAADDASCLDAAATTTPAIAWLVVADTGAPRLLQAAAFKNVTVNQPGAPFSLTTDAWDVHQVPSDAIIY